MPCTQFINISVGVPRDMSVLCHVKYVAPIVYKSFNEVKTGHVVYPQNGDLVRVDIFLYKMRM